MIVKYYNRKIDCTKNNIFIKSWNIIERAKNDSWSFNKYKDSFKTSLKRIQFDIIYVKTLKFNILNIYLISHFY